MNWVFNNYHYGIRDSVTQGPCKINPATGIYDDNCVFEFQSNFSPQSSLMSSFSISSVDLLSHLENCHMDFKTEYFLFMFNKIGKKKFK